jgi:hypothetical protein
MEAAARPSLEHTANCCNGRAGRELAELAQQNPAISRLVTPTGVEVLRTLSEAGLAAKDTVNCCNGRVGRNVMEELVTALGGS